MVRQKSGDMSSPTPSVENLNSALPLYDLDRQKADSGVDSSPTSSSSSASSPVNQILAESPKCSACSGFFVEPKVLSCLHSFCKSCLEKVVTEKGCKIVCPKCSQESTLGPNGVGGLLDDYAAARVGKAEACEQNLTCSTCKLAHSSVVAKCFTCIKFFCSTCILAHELMFRSCEHQVSTLGEMSKNYDSSQSIKQLDFIYSLIQDAKRKSFQIDSSLKSLDDGLNKLTDYYGRTQKDITEAYQMMLSHLQNRRMDLLKELDAHYSSKKMAMNVYQLKAQETADNLRQMTSFAERLLQNATNQEVLQFKKPLEQLFAATIANKPEMNLDNICDFKFVTDQQIMQSQVKSTLGYIKSKQIVPAKNVNPVNASGNPSRQPPISRPTSLAAPPVSPALISPIGLSSPMVKYCGGAQSSPVHKNVPPPANSFYEQQGQMAAKSFSFSERQHTFGPLFGTFASMGSSGMTAGMPWTPLTGQSMDGQKIFGSPWASVSNGLPTDTQVGFNAVPGGDDKQSKSTLKRQKMIYHCKFGEFGVLEGQFTEPSGVAVNAQNDIIVADTNNHRIQIFDKEGRFKFQFGECGRQDGQLLYPNRVAVIRNSGDIVVTERSPIHQIQIYNQYGQFVRKFGADILQYPRGVCVDSKGRIVIVECKIMRVIIFDQLGNVLTKFGCSKHLEFPNGVVVNDRQEIFVSDNRAHCVKVFNYDGVFLRQIGGEGITNYPIGVGINSAGEIAIADNHNNFNLTVFSQDGQLLSALESKVRHAQCFDVALTTDGSVILASKDYRVYIYRYIQVPNVCI